MYGTYVRLEASLHELHSMRWHSLIFTPSRFATAFGWLGPSAGYVLLRTLHFGRHFAISALSSRVARKRARDCLARFAAHVAALLSVSRAVLLRFASNELPLIDH